MPTVSVIVPLYNKARYVERALASIARQSWTDFEVIVVDDGSTDGSAAIAEGFPDPRLTVVRQANQGPGAARNQGIALSRGELIGFLDADDEWLETYLEQGVRALQCAREAATHTCGNFEDPDGRDARPMWVSRGIRDGVQRVTPGTPPERFLHWVAFMSPCTTLVRAEVARRFGGFYSEGGCRYAEDAHLWLRVLLHEPVSFTPDAHVRIHREASQLSATTRVRRPLEPFLRHPEEIRAACPPELTPLLEDFFAIRAFKTASAWAYWGNWRAARALMRRFRVPGRRRLPYYWLAQCVATPFGAAAGGAARALARILGRG